MKMMGLPNWMNWLSWYLNGVLTSFLVVGIIVFLLCVDFDEGKLLEFSDWSVIYFYLMLHASGLVLLTFALSACFDNRKRISILPKNEY